MCFKGGSHGVWLHKSSAKVDPHEAATAPHGYGAARPVGPMGRTGQSHGPHGCNGPMGTMGPYIYICSYVYTLHYIMQHELQP